MKLKQLYVFVLHRLFWLPFSIRTWISLRRMQRKSDLSLGLHICDAVPVFFLSSSSTPTTTAIVFIFSCFILPILTFTSLFEESFSNSFETMHWSRTDILIRRHVWPAGIYISISMYSEIPQDHDIFCLCYWFKMILILVLSIWGYYYHYYYYYYFIPYEIFTPALADGFPLESVWQQVFSGLQNYGSRWSLSEDSGFKSYPSRPEVYLVKNVVR